MLETSRRHKLPYIQAAQAQKHVTHNAALEQLDITHNLCLMGLNLSSAPTNPELGDCYDIGDTSNGFFETHANHIAAFLDTGWQFYPKVKGMIALNASSDSDDQGLIIYNGIDWQPITSTNSTEQVAPQQSPQFGVNTSADEINKFSVKSEAVLLAADDQDKNSTGDIRLSLNKMASINTASIIYQSNYTAHAETGLTGKDNYIIRVSNSGDNFKTAFEIDKTTGYVGLGKSPTEALGITDTRPGLSRISLSNAHSDGFAGSAMTLAAGNNHSLQLLQYNSGATYILSTSSSMFYQITGANASYRFFLGSEDVLSINQNSIKANSPLRLANYTLSNLPLAATSGAGAVIFISNAPEGPILAYSDGSHWRSSITGQNVS